VSIAIAHLIFGLIKAWLDDRLQVTKLANSNSTPFCRFGVGSKRRGDWENRFYSRTRE